MLKRRPAQPTKFAPRSVVLAVRGISMLLLVACSSDSSPSSTPESLAPADPSSGSSCPFTGTTGATSGPGLESGATIAKVTVAKSGCIDNVTASFGTAPPAWTVAYQDGPFVDAKTGQAVTPPGPVTLVVTFKGTIDASLPGGTTPATLDPSSLDYIQAVTVISGPSGSLEWIISLSQQMQYTTSSSQVPADFVLGIG
jgi:hypothetical protein